MLDSAHRVVNCKFAVATTAGRGLIIDYVKAFFYELVPGFHSQLHVNDLCFFVIQYYRYYFDLLTIIPLSSQEYERGLYPLYFASIECREFSSYSSDILRMSYNTNRSTTSTQDACLILVDGHVAYRRRRRSTGCSTR